MKVSAYEVKINGEVKYYEFSLAGMRAIQEMAHRKRKTITIKLVEVEKEKVIMC